ncbi:MAG: alanine--glyoxylate aminotransferase family protein [Chloroflexi bacterium]|nr:alanine--glyoxylate aminotransferase family protein [Chloroflexota bacterium]
MTVGQPPQLGERLNPQRLLLGPGPANVLPQVLQAASAPLLGHLDPVFLEIMNDVQQGLRYLFQTENPLTLAAPGTGSSGMEAALSSIIEPGDAVVTGICGYFGNRLAEVAERCGARVTRVEGEWGRPLDPDDLRQVVASVRPRVVAFVHAETSTGVAQDPQPIIAAAHAVGALVVMDTVTSLGGIPVLIDEWNVDVAYSASQKCVGSLSGLAPITVTPTTVARILSRHKPVQSFYLDVTLLGRYWSEERLYHHTASSPAICALREALRVITEEGLATRWERHRRVAQGFRAGLRAMGLQLLVPEDCYLPQLTTVMIPEGTDDSAVRKALLAEWNIEIGGGLGPFKGKLWRVGLMGAGCTPTNALTLLDALGQTLRQSGATVDVAAGQDAALETWRS